jgi:lysozyme
MENELNIGERVQKIGGSYQASGEIRAVFTTRAGQKRAVFEFDEPPGMLHIFNLDQLASIMEPSKENHMSYDEDALRLELIRDEGKRLTPYRDSMGNWTVGIGHLLKRGEKRETITERQCLEYLIGDIVDAEQKLDSILPGWRNHGDARQRALVNLAFNLGWGLKQFVNFLNAMEREDYASAGRHLRDSKWAEQVKRRAPRIIHMIVTDTAWEGV